MKDFKFKCRYCDEFDWFVDAVQSYKTVLRCGSCQSTVVCDRTPYSEDDLSEALVSLRRQFPEPYSVNRVSPRDVRIRSKDIEIARDAASKLQAQAYPWEAYNSFVEPPIYNETLEQWEVRLTHFTSE